MTSVKEKRTTCLFSIVDKKNCLFSINHYGNLPCWKVKIWLNIFFVLLFIHFKFLNLAAGKYVPRSTDWSIIYTIIFLWFFFLRKGLLCGNRYFSLSLIYRNIKCYLPAQEMKYRKVKQIFNRMYICSL